MSARDEILDLVAAILPSEHVAQYTGIFGRRLDTYRDQVRREAATTVRRTKLRTELNYDDRRVNRALERAAVKIEEGEG
ncbi:hypothetical protein [Streptomyces sp. NPDC046925]|uniref:hypothetical protein n=1 Tax=Streptomyces sp. NPDC046925 TaxID=3155375 RepID=UPI0033EA2A23